MCDFNIANIIPNKKVNNFDKKTVMSSEAMF